MHYRVKRPGLAHHKPGDVVKDPAWPNLPVLLKQHYVEPCDPPVAMVETSPLPAAKEPRRKP